ncbi:MAG TPA: DegT/DnrJ/EryC1/StrS aminotransferase family protein [Acidimicrobiales bacterium]|nr:DegT/DnrJ/EryC1/StrS aminotransferase family protein [Acidimicrobiales bacterium]
MSATTTAPDVVAFAPPDVTESDVEAVTRVLRSGWLTTGEECARLERDLASYLGGAEVVAVASCTAALEMAFAALDLAPGARVAVPTWTFVASALAPARQGVRPVLLDVDEDTLNVSADALAAELEEGLDGVVAVHFGGVPVSGEVLRLCSAAGVPVVEDAAHALGAEDHRGPIAGRGTVAACFSFYATKNLTAGEGGALVTESPALADFARSHRLHGLSSDALARYRPGGPASYELRRPGIKANLPDLLAALARSQLARYEEMQARRRETALRYRKELSRIPDVRLVPRQLDEGGADHLMAVVLPDGADRAVVRARMAEARIGTSVHFRPLHTFPWFAEHALVGRVGTRVAAELAPRVLSLPLHSTLTAEQVDRVCDVLADALRL